jgi:hypothetical protein
MSVAAFCAVTVVANTLAAQTPASAAPEMEDKRNIITRAPYDFGALSGQRYQIQGVPNNFDLTLF